MFSKESGAKENTRGLKGLRVTAATGLFALIAVGCSGGGEASGGTTSQSTRVVVPATLYPMEQQSTDGVWIQKDFSRTDPEWGNPYGVMSIHLKLNP